MTKEDERSRPALEAAQKPLADRYANIIDAGSFAAIQSSSTAEIVRQIYALDERDGSGLSTKRNERICQNIRSALANVHGKRVLIVFGLDHKYYLDDCARHLGAQLVEATDVLNEATTAPQALPADVRERAIRNLRDAKQLLQNRIDTAFYTGTLAARVARKVPLFDSWIAKLEAP